MHEIHPNEIPIRFVDMIKVFRKNGEITTMNKDDLINTVPLNGPVDWDKIASNYHDIVDMEIYIDHYYPLYRLPLSYSLSIQNLIVAYNL